MLTTLLLAVVLATAACTSSGGEAGEAGDDPGLAGGSEVAAGAPSGASEGGSGAPAGALLEEIRSRGDLLCGVNEAVPGFGLQNEEGDFEGFDIDICKAIAAAILGDAEAVEYRPLSSEQRFIALQAGEIDVLSRNTTWTASRDGTDGADFVTTTFYDGQGIMVKADSEYQAIEDLEGSPICVLSGTTTEQNLATRFADIDYEPVPSDDVEVLLQSFQEDRCDAYTSDRSQLAGLRSTLPDGPDSVRILDEVFSKEPLGPAVREGEADLFDAVNWAVLTLIAAEEFGVTSDNVEDMTSSEDPAILAFLGQAGGVEGAVLDPGLGLEPDFAVDVISAVGNYAEIYERNITPLEIPRELNSLYTDGGLLYAPPYR
jgi:general L-amino acid transport system substrate-binding protein